MNFHVSSCRMMTSVMGKAYVNSADRFLSASASLPPKKLPSVCIFTLISHLLHVSVFAGTIPSWKSCITSFFQCILRNGPSVMGARSPKWDFWSAPQVCCVGPASNWPLPNITRGICVAVITKKIQSKRPATSAAIPRKSRAWPTFYSLFQHISTKATALVNIYWFFPPAKVYL